VYVTGHWGPACVQCELAGLTSNGLPVRHRLASALASWVHACTASSLAGRVHWVAMVVALALKVAGSTHSHIPSTAAWASFGFVWRFATCPWHRGTTLSQWSLLWRRQSTTYRLARFSEGSHGGRSLRVHGHGMSVSPLAGLATLLGFACYVVVVGALRLPQHRGLTDGPLNEGASPRLLRSCRCCLPLRGSTAPAPPLDCAALHRSTLQGACQSSARCGARTYGIVKPCVWVACPYGSVSILTHWLLSSMMARG
jgi:hypothetical protein